MNPHNPHSPRLNVIHLETVHDSQGVILMCTIRGTVCLEWETPEDAPKLPKVYIPKGSKHKPPKEQPSTVHRETPLHTLLASPGIKEVYGVYPSSDLALEYIHRLRWHGCEFSLVCTTGGLLEAEDKALDSVRTMLMELSQ